MREIKFRAYDEEANVMVYSDEHNSIDYSYEYFFEVLKDKVICVFLVDYDDSFGAPSTDRCELEKVMQYTGLHDKNGVEIYENDKVFDGKYYGIIEYRECSFVINWEIDCSHDDDLNYWNDKLEVIGNIHEVEEDEI